MSKKKGIIIGAISLAVILVGVFAFFMFRTTNCDYEDLGKITYMKFSVEEDEYELVKEDGIWYWADQKELLLDDMFIDEQVKIAKKELQITKTEEKGSLKDYGLDKVKFTLVLKDSKGRKIEINRGDMVGDENYFVRIGKGKTVYTASYKIMDVIDSLAAMRTKSEDMEFVGEE